MKKKIILVCASLLMTSCSLKTYYQVVEVKSTNVQKESNNYVYNDGDCKIIYNFWGEGGDAGFTIENLSDVVLYVDLGKTFYIENGKAYDYYRAKTGKNLKLVEANNSSNKSNSDIAFTEKPVVAIPPHASKSLYGYIIMDDVIQDCSVNLMVKKNQPEAKTYTESESPICFSNFISYRKGESEASKVITNDFYISGYTNYMSTDIIKVENVGCKKTLKLEYFDKCGSEYFYVEYNKTHSNHYSADAKGNATSSKIKKKVSPNGASYYSVRKE